MSKAMSFSEFQEIVEYACKHNSPVKVPSRIGHFPRVKYIDPHFDLRTEDVFSVTIRTFGGTYQFFVQNEFRECQFSLKDRILTFLNTPHEDLRLVKNLWVEVDQQGNKLN